jgi:hypothetical protein
VKAAGLSRGSCANKLPELGAAGDDEELLEEETLGHDELDIEVMLEDNVCEELDNAVIEEELDDDGTAEDEITERELDHVDGDGIAEDEPGEEADEELVDEADEKELEDEELDKREDVPLEDADEDETELQTMELSSWTKLKN